MTKRPWTPGPWTIHESRIDGACFACGNDGYPIGSQPKQRANAYLIAAAPELYEKLEGAIAVLTQIYGAPLNNPAIKDMRAALRAANPAAFKEGE